MCLLYGIHRADSVGRDREVLCALLKATDKMKKGQRYGRFRTHEAHQDGWRCKDGWKSSLPMGEWHGVTTNAEGRVIALDLHDNDLSGTTTWIV